MGWVCGFDGLGSVCGLGGLGSVCGQAHKEEIEHTHLRELLKDQARCEAMIT